MSQSWSPVDDETGKGGDKKGDYSYIAFASICSLCVTTCILLYVTDVASGPIFSWLFFIICWSLTLFCCIGGILFVRFTIVDPIAKLEYVSYVVLIIVATWFSYDATFQTFMISLATSISRDVNYLIDLFISLPLVMIVGLVLIIRGWKNK